MLTPPAAGRPYLDEVSKILEGYQGPGTETGSAGGSVVFLTSGSTGAPKLVKIPAAGISTFMHWGTKAFSFGPDTVSLSLSPWNFDVSVLDTWSVLAAGGTVVAADAEKIHQRGYCSELLTEHRISFLQLVPATLQALLSDLAPEHRVSSVRDVVITGGVASRAQREVAAQHFPQAVFHNVYGSTEVNDCLIFSTNARNFAAASELPLGIPIEGCQFRIRTETGQLIGLAELAEGAKGELLVRTPWMAEGYLENTGLRNLLDQPESFYPMRDLVQVRNNHLHFIGRIDRTVKLRGQRVSLDDIEASATSIPGISQSVAWVTGSAGSEAISLAYTAIADQPHSLSGLTIRKGLSAKLPGYAMPNRIHNLGERFPLNSNGKPSLVEIMRITDQE